MGRAGATALYITARPVRRVIDCVGGVSDGMCATVPTPPCLANRLSANPNTPHSTAMKLYTVICLVLLFLGPVVGFALWLYDLANEWHSLKPERLAEIPAPPLQPPSVSIQRPAA